jgi:alpha-galactosidase
VPLHGTGTWAAMPHGAGNDYQARSAMGPGTMLAVFPYAAQAPTPDHPWDWHRRMIAEARRVQTMATGDYYPLTGCHPDDEDWAAYQLDRPDLGEGLVMAFRRRRSPWKTAQFRLRGLDGAAAYEFTDADAPTPWLGGGRELNETGLEIAIPRPDSSRLIFYRRIVT